MVAPGMRKNVPQWFMPVGGLERSYVRAGRQERRRPYCGTGCRNMLLRELSDVPHGLSLGPRTLGAAEHLTGLAELTTEVRCIELCRTKR